MVKATTRLTPRGHSLAVTLSKDVLEAAGLKQGDELVILARDDGIIEISRAAPGEAQLDAAFDWVVGRYPRTLADLAK